MKTKASVPTLTEWKGFRADPDNLPLKRPGAYRLINLLNGKIYVGISQDVLGRLRSHAKNGSPKRLKAALRKYGLTNFKIEPLCYSIALRDTKWLPFLEADLIKENDAIKNGYNVMECDGSVGPYGPAFGAILSAATKISANTPERRALSAKVAKIMWDALWADPERRAALIARWYDQDVREKRSASAKLSWQDPVVAAARLAYFDDPEIEGPRRKKISASLKTSEKFAEHVERSRSPERRTASSIRFKTHWADPVWREATLKAREAATEKRLASIKRAWETRPRYCITDGLVNRMVHSCETIPEGWRRGRVNINSRKA